jgi:hypothetical protein
MNNLSVTPTGQSQAPQRLSSDYMRTTLIDYFSVSESRWTITPAPDSPGNDGAS